MPRFKIVAVGVRPEGSGALPFGPKNQSKVGEGILGSGKEGLLSPGERVAEQFSEYVSPAIEEEPEEAMATEKGSEMRVKNTACGKHHLSTSLSH